MKYTYETHFTVQQRTYPRDGGQWRGGFSPKTLFEKGTPVERPVRKATGLKTVYPDSPSKPGCQRW